MSRKRTFFSILLLAALLLTVVACSPNAASPGAAQTAGEGGITVVGTGERLARPTRLRSAAQRPLPPL